MSSTGGGCKSKASSAATALAGAALSGPEETDAGLFSPLFVGLSPAGAGADAVSGAMGARWIGFPSAMYMVMGVSSSLFSRRTVTL